MKYITASQWGITTDLERLSFSIYKALTQYPYYAIVNGFAPLRESTQLIDLVRAIRDKLSPHSRINYENIDKVSFTKVYINRQVKAAADGGVTKYSRTYLPLPPHTDSSYMPIPHEMVAFQCIEADENGGETIMVPIDDILKHLDENTLALLREPVYPFGQEYYAIICDHIDHRMMRYYHAQIERSLTPESSPLSEPYQSALKILNTLLNQTERFYKFRLKPGQILFMHNHKVLHGRTELSPQTNRLFYRLRLHVASLSAGENLENQISEEVYK